MADEKQMETTYLPKDTAPLPVPGENTYLQPQKAAAKHGMPAWQIILIVLAVLVGWGLPPAQQSAREEASAEAEPTRTYVEFDINSEQARDMINLAAIDLGYDERLENLDAVTKSQIDETVEGGYFGLLCGVKMWSNNATGKVKAIAFLLPYDEDSKMSYTTSWNGFKACASAISGKENSDACVQALSDSMDTLAKWGEALHEQNGVEYRMYVENDVLVVMARPYVDEG